MHRHEGIDWPDGACLICFYQDSLAKRDNMIAAKNDEITQLLAEKERSLQMLETLGVTRERMHGDAATGIDVLATRYRKEIVALRDRFI